MTAETLRSLAFTLMAIALAYGLWVASATMQDWVGAPELLPLVRVVVIAIGLSLAEWLYQRLPSRKV